MGWCFRAALLSACLLSSASACSTLVAGRLATDDGSVMVAHSNDGDGGTAGNLKIVPSADHALPATRGPGPVAQVAHTYAYFTKVGGYASTNEHQVALAESTCVAVFRGNRSAGAALNIVDLSELGLERANSSRAAVQVMGDLAVRYGYYDAGESLLVADPVEAFVFHVLPDDTGAAAVWVAQRVPDDHVGVVANSFTVREVDFDDAHNFLASPNMRDVARRAGRWGDGVPLDFTRVFAGAEPGHRYSAGHRMWSGLRHLGDPAAHAALPLHYNEYVSEAPYPTTLRARPGGVSLAALTATMRDYYANTTLDMTAGMAAGAFGTPDRWAAGAGEAALGAGSWERTIAISRTIVSYVVQCRRWLPDEVGGVLWLSFHAAHTSFYVPFPVGMAAANSPLPPGVTTNAVGSVGRGVAGWQAARFVFNTCQLRFADMITHVAAAQEKWEGAGRNLTARNAADWVSGAAGIAEVAKRTSAHATAVVAAWWELADSLMLAYADGYCNGCGRGPRHLGYPRWWLASKEVNYTGGPPPALPVPPPPTQPPARAHR